MSCATTEPAGCGRRGKNDFASLQMIVNDYVQHYRKRAAEELNFYRSIESLSEVIRVAANAVTADSKRHDHQRRIPGGALARFARALLAIEDRIETAKSFSTLHNVIKDAASELKHIGRLTVYDTALRIGIKLGLDPDHVYLHAGTREGAKFFNVDTKEEHLPKSSFPVELDKLEPYEIEDLLCIYKDELQHLKKLGRLYKT